MNTTDEPLQLKSRFPRKMLIWTGFVAVLLFVAHWQKFSLNEKFNLDPAYISLLTLLLGLITIIAWGFWAFFWGKHRILGMLIFLLPIGFFTLYYPNLNGDVGISGFKPRFWSNKVAYAELAPAAKTGEGETSDVALVDLKTTSPKDFPQFLGPNRNAQVNSVSLSDSWPTTATPLWKIDIGEGWSGFVVVNGNAITQEQRGAFECVTCYDINTGEVRWINKVQRRHEDVAAMGKVGPRATPTVHEGMVYVTSGTGVLDCLDGSTGETVWTANVPKLVGIEQIPIQSNLGFEYTTESSRMLWGRSCSPLIVDDNVIIPAGGPDEDSENETATLIAFDKKTGKEKWRGGNRMVAYGSPTLETIAGKRQILLVAEDHAVGHDAETGEELWSHARPGGTSSNANCSQVTVVDEDRVLLSKGYNLGGELIQLSSTDGKWSVKSLRKDARVLKTKFTNPVVVDGFAYTLSDGFLECSEIGKETITRKWKQRGHFGNGQILMVGDKILVHSESGKLYLIKASPEEYTELGSFNTISGLCWNTICLSGDLVLVRSELEAACFRLPTESQ